MAKNRKVKSKSGKKNRGKGRTPAFQRNLPQNKVPASAPDIQPDYVIEPPDTDIEMFYGKPDQSELEIKLTKEERARFEELISRIDEIPLHQLNARILLLADTGEFAVEKLSDEQIKAKMHIPDAIIYRAKRLFVEKRTVNFTGVSFRAGRPREVSDYVLRKALEIYNSPPPAGKSKWSCRAVARELVRQEYVDSISHETLRTYLKQGKTKEEQNRELVDIINEITSESPLDNGVPTWTYKNIYAELKKRYPAMKVAYNQFVSITEIKNKDLEDKKNRVLEIYNSPPPNGKKAWTQIDLLAEMKKQGIRGLGLDTALKIIYKDCGKKFSEAFEQKLLELSRSIPPDGKRWTLTALAKAAVDRGYIDYIHPVTIRNFLDRLTEVSAEDRKKIVRIYRDAQKNGDTITKCCSNVISETSLYYFSQNILLGIVKEDGA